MLMEYAEILDAFEGLERKISRLRSIKPRDQNEIVELLERAKQPIEICMVRREKELLRELEAAQPHMHATGKSSGA